LCGFVKVQKIVLGDNGGATNSEGYEGWRQTTGATMEEHGGATWNVLQHISWEVSLHFFIRNFCEPFVKHLKRDLFDLVRWFSFGIGLISWSIGNLWDWCELRQEGWDFFSTPEIIFRKIFGKHFLQC